MKYIILILALSGCSPVAIYKPMELRPSLWDESTPDLSKKAEWGMALERY